MDAELQNIGMEKNKENIEEDLYVDFMEDAFDENEIINDGGYDMDNDDYDDNDDELFNGDND